ncbi:unnamed protein product [Soboliphyme baturini]|uniref:SCP domain-containing protein n=1 Tax=Soboliphyme baturini TaxID=241478 RepID=A0A183IMD7_9BILA|nr:unnamed protein product [Soboliphyme baturini]
MLSVVTLTDVFGGNGEDRTLTTSKKKAAISFALNQWFNERKFFTWPNKCNPTCCSFKAMMYDKGRFVGCSIAQCDNLDNGGLFMPRAIQIVCGFEPMTFSTQPYEGGDLDCPHDYPVRREDGLCAAA